LHVPVLLFHRWLLKRVCFHPLDFLTPWKLFDHICEGLLLDSILLHWSLYTSLYQHHGLICVAFW
jgi:hypothetical protein